MAVAAGVLLEVLLVVLLGGEEVMKGQQLYFKGRAHLGGLGVEGGLKGRQLIRVRVVDAGPILDTLVLPLFVEGQGVDDQKEEVQEPVQGHPLLIIIDADRLGVAAVAADLPIGGGFVGAVGVAHLGGSDPLELIEKFLQAPETAACQVDGPHQDTSFP